MAVYDLGKITDWISSVGTLGAVIVALYLANRERRPRAKVVASFLYAVDDFRVSKKPFAVNASIVNIGLIPIHLKECTIMVGKNRMAFPDGDHNVDKILTPGEMYSHVLPHELIAKHFMRENIKKYKTDICFEDGRGKKYKTKIIFRF